MMSLSRNHNFSKIYGKWMNMDTCCCKQYRENTFCHCQKCRSEWHALGRNKSWSHWLHLWHRLKLAPECWSWRRCGSVGMVAMWWLCGGWRERRTVKSLWVNCLFCVGGWDIKAFQSWLTSHGVQNQKKTNVWTQRPLTLPEVFMKIIPFQKVASSECFQEFIFCWNLLKWYRYCPGFHTRLGKARGRDFRSCGLGCLLFWANSWSGTKKW